MSMAVTATMVQELREKSGARMMDCKEALKQTDGDFEKALNWLKQKNMDSDVSQKSSSEGLLAYRDDSGAITVVEMTASTDFATSNQEFKDVLAILVGIAHANAFDSVEKLNQHVIDNGIKVADAVKELAGKIGENVSIKRVVRFEGNFGYYIHFDNKQGAVVELEGVSGELAKKIGKDIAMHIVFAKPMYASRDEVPTDLVDKEKSIILARLADDPKNSKKPPQIIDKIVTGQLGKFFSQSVLVDQGYYKEEKKAVAEVLKELGDIKVKRFVRFQVGS